ncbi:MAG: Uma2 family endonuclease [Flammeovirgaceae bacterium]
MELTDLDVTKLYTYADYLTWKLKERVELIKGKLFKMSPAPSMQHQRVLRRLTKAFLNKFEESSCEIFFAPFDVRLPKKDYKDTSIYTVVQPDLCVVCDKNKLDKRGCLGAPDLIIEILSPGNTKKEMRDKYEVYQESGVREYWLVDFFEKTVLVYVLDDRGKFIGLQPNTEDQVISPTIFPEVAIDLSEIFIEDVEL